jgi:hypothetical protein
VTTDGSSSSSSTGSGVFQQHPSAAVAKGSTGLYSSSRALKGHYGSLKMLEAARQQQQQQQQLEDSCGRSTAAVSMAAGAHIMFRCTMPDHLLPLANHVQGGQAAAPSIAAQLAHRQQYLHGKLIGAKQQQDCGSSAQSVRPAVAAGTDRNQQQQ